MLKKKEFNQKKKKRRRKRFSQRKRTPRRTRQSEPPSCQSTVIGDQQWWCGGLERRRWRGGLERWRWWILSLSLISMLSFSHSDSLSHIRCGFWFALNFCCGSLRLAWIGDQNRQQGLKIGGDSMVVWRSAAMAWWFGAVAMVDSLSFSHSNSLSQIGCGFWFCFEFFAGSIRIVLLLF